jgi:ribosome-associated toxin RatA of RatAB toxin-antitoxin module
MFFSLALLFCLVCSYNLEYAIVATMDLYKDFVPWSQSSRILWHIHDDDDQVFLDVEIEVGFKFFVESHILHVELVKATQLDQAKYPSIPFPSPPKKDPHPPSFLLFV